MSTTIEKSQNGTPSVRFENVVSDLFQNSFQRFFGDNLWGVSSPLTTGVVPLSFTLDDSVDVTNISAAYTDGILRITLPKNEKAKKMSRNIEVK